MHCIYREGEFLEHAGKIDDAIEVFKKYADFLGSSNRHLGSDNNYVKAAEAYEHIIQLLEE